jgi:hypothetical protein
MVVHMDGTPSWSFLTNHAQVLPAAGYISRRRTGRRNHYTIKSHLPLPDPLAREQKIGDLLAVLTGQSLAETGG